jgi:2-polyprenyl-6-methoxyphenol hydroxylase-like FAD-dependent oxidoreductase
MKAHKMFPVSNHDEKARQDFVVIGGGPAGLSAALAAKKNGATRVLVLESRTGERARNNVLLLDSGIVAALQELGVDVSHFTPATDFTFIDADAGLLYQFPLAADLNPRGQSSVWSMFPRRTPCADVLISELEQVLLQAIADEPGIDLLQGVEISLIEKSGMHRVSFSYQGGEYSVEPGVIAICDGARSSTLEKLGVQRLGTPRQEVAMVANFHQPGKGQIKFERADRSEEVLALCSKRGTTITVRMPLDTVLADFDDSAQRIEFMRHHARKVGVEGEFISEPMVVEISHGKADRCQLGNGIFVLGDAARTATPRLGLGVNWAIRDAIRLGKLLPRIRSRHSMLARWAAWTYRARTRVASEVLLFQGWMLKHADHRSVQGKEPSKWRFLQKSLLMRFSWRAGKGITAPYDMNRPFASIAAARQSVKTA